MPDSLAALHAELEQTDFYPQLISDALDLAVGSQPIVSHLVHPETMFDSSSVKRHITVLALTKTRLIVAHVDDYPDPSGPVSVSTSTEVVPLSRISSTVLAQHVEDPSNYRAGSLPSALTLAIGWGAVSRVELDPATCGDPDCDADHGLTGSINVDDVVLRISEQAQGSECLASAISFARELVAATSR